MATAMSIGAKGKADKLVVDVQLVEYQCSLVGMTMLGEAQKAKCEYGL